MKSQSLIIIRDNVERSPECWLDNSENSLHSFWKIRAFWANMMIEHWCGISLENKVCTDLSSLLLESERIAGGLAFISKDQEKYSVKSQISLMPKVEWIWGKFGSWKMFVYNKMHNIEIWLPCTEQFLCVRYCIMLLMTSFYLILTKSFLW